MLGWRRARLAAGGCDEVEPVSLTMGAVVAALVLKGGEKTGENVTEGGLAAIGRLVDRVRARFRDRGDAGAEEALGRVEAFTRQRSELLATLEQLTGGASERTARVTGMVGDVHEYSARFYASWMASHERGHLRSLPRIIRAVAGTG